MKGFVVLKLFEIHVTSSNFWNYWENFLKNFKKPKKKTFELQDFLEPLGKWFALKKEYIIFRFNLEITTGTECNWMKLVDVINYQEKQDFFLKSASVVWSVQAADWKMCEKWVMLWR